MVRNYKRKTERNAIDEEAMDSAISEVLDGSLSIRKAADKYNIKTATLQHRIEKKKKYVEKEGEEESYSSKYTSQQVFTTEQEKLLNEYVIKCIMASHWSKFDNLPMNTQKKVTVFIPVLGILISAPDLDWIEGFRRRNPNISLRKPENTSVARSFSFSKAAVTLIMRPYPKIIQRSKTNKGREKGKSRIYTDTPEKQRLEEQQRAKGEREAKKEQRKRARELKNAQKLLGIVANPKKTVTKKTKAITMESDSSSCASEIEFQESFDSDETYCSEDDVYDTPAVVSAAGELKKGDFVLIKLATSRKKLPVKHYVGKILFKYGEDGRDGLSDFHVSFLKRKPSGTFVFPNRKDEASVHISDIVLKLPSPTVKKGTNRTASLFKFNIDLSTYNIPL